jgi:hypothetical protein
MTTTFTQAQGTVSSSILNLGTLASATYIASSALDLTSAIPLDKTLMVECVPNGTPTGNMQLCIFAQLSLDNSTFTAGPTSGTTATHENQLHWIGNLLINVTAVTHRKMFSLAGLPVTRYMKIVAKNDMGVALTSGNIYWSDITGVGT